MHDQFDTAQQAFQRGHFQVAIKILKHLDQGEMSIAANHLLVKSLFITHQFDAARRYVSLMVNTYVNNRDDFTLLLKVLLANNLFLQVRKILSSVNDNRLKNKFLKIVTEQEQTMLSEHRDQITDWEHTFYQLADQPMATQKRILQTAEHLPIDSFVTGSKYLLQNPFVNPVVRSELLEDLIELEIHDTVKVNCIDNQIHSIDLESLLPLKKTKSYRMIMKLIADDYSNNDNFKLNYFKHTFNMYLLYTYPLNDQIINDPAKWLIIANQILVSPFKEMDSNGEVAKWQLKLNRITDKLMFK